MFNIYEKIKATPDYYRQLRCGDSLVTLFNCQSQEQYLDAWSQYNYFVYVVHGRRVCHTAHGSYDLKKGDCVFVRKGGCIAEQFFDAKPCFIYLFMPDDFINEVLQHKALPVVSVGKQFEPVIRVEDNHMVKSFFNSMISYFENNYEPDPSLIQLKFRELILTLSDNVANGDLRSFFSLLKQKPRAIAIQKIMEENFCFNLGLEEFAQLCGRSLSAFKRDFEEQFQTSPGKWLLEKRLDHALHLMTNLNKTVGESAFESGFKSASHFSRSFRQRFGISPALVRRPVTI